MDNETFRAFCIRVADEKDPDIVELLKQRLRLLLSETPTELANSAKFRHTIN